LGYFTSLPSGWAAWPNAHRVIGVRLYSLKVSSKACQSVFDKNATRSERLIAYDIRKYSLGIFTTLFHTKSRVSCLFAVL